MEDTLAEILVGREQSSDVKRYVELLLRNDLLDRFAGIWTVDHFILVEELFTAKCETDFGRRLIESSALFLVI